MHPNKASSLGFPGGGRIQNEQRRNTANNLRAPAVNGAVAPTVTLIAMMFMPPEQVHDTGDKAVAQAEPDRRSFRHKGTLKLWTGGMS
jgi:hypothetical protein